MSDVFYSCCEDYSAEKIDAALKRCLLPLLRNADILSGKKVMIKPNLLEYRKKNDPACVHPQLIVSLCRFLKDHGAAEIAIIENPAVQHAEAIIAAMKIADELSSLGVKVATCTAYEKISMPHNSRFRQLEIATEYRSYDLVIDLAKAKTHAMMTLTLGVKNLFGLIRGTERLAWHLTVGREFNDFADMLLDLYLAVLPEITLIDGVIGMEGNGPGSGDAVHLGFLCAGRDALSVDASVSERLGVKKMPLLVQAKKRQLFNEFVNCGEIPEIRQIKLPEPPDKSLEWGVYFPVKLRKLLRGMMLSRPVVDHGKCIKCGLCVQKCPPQSLKVINGKLKFCYSNCIRCYCCQEYCPKGAITVRASLTGKFFALLEKFIRGLNISRRAGK